MKWKWTKIIVGLLAAGVLALGAFYLAGYRLLAESSMPRGVWKCTQTRTDYALVRLPEKWTALAMDREYTHKAWIGNRERDTVKKVVGREGDFVRISAEGIQINGQLLPHSAPLREDSKGRPMPVIELEETRLKPGQFIVLSSEASNGFDSRYYGILEARHLVAYALPIWTEERRVACLPPAS